MNKTTIYTDGSSRGNPGPGGWGAVVVNNRGVEELGGREEHTTNNRMEIMAAIMALENVKSEDGITLYSDSQYVIKGITEWIKGWQRNGWRNSQKKDVMNRDLWERLNDAVQDKKIEWKYIKGHAENVGNERCDVIATSFADGIPEVLYKGASSHYTIKLS